jgi:hypothetical protein
MHLSPDHPFFSLSSRFEVVDGYWIPRDMVESSSSTSVHCTNNVIIRRRPRTGETVPAAPKPTPIKD